MKSLFTFLFSLILLFASAQETCIRWSWKSEDGKTGKSVGFSKPECFDLEYGRYPIKAYSPIELALEVDGVYLTRWEALKELRKPIWGDGTQKFQDVLPDLVPSVPEYFFIDQHPFYTDSIPTLVEGHELVPYGYELRQPTVGGYMFVQRASLAMTLLLLNNGFEEWRPYNPIGRQIMKIPNPQYTVVQNIREQQKQEYLDIIENTFTQVGSYYFPPFYYTDGNLRWWIKYEGEDYVEITPDKNFWLAATFTSGYKYFVRPLREKDMLDWNKWFSTAQYDNDKRVKLILGIK